MQKSIFQRGVDYGLKVPIRCPFQWRKTTAGWLQSATWKKGAEFDSKVSYSFETAKWNEKELLLFESVKKMFLCQKVDKSVQFNSLFLQIPKMLLCVRIGQVAFFVWGLKRVVCLKQCPLYGFCFNDAWKGSI